MRNARWLVVLPTVLAGCDSPSIAGRPTFSRSVSIGVPVVELAAGDIDNDGRIDLVGVHRDGGVAIRLQRANGWVEPPAQPPELAAHMAALGDVNADGHLDLVTTSHDSGDVIVCLGKGNGTFAAPKPSRAVTSAKPHNHGLLVADLDGDRAAEVIVADQTAKQLVVLRGPALDKPTTIALPDQPYPPAFGDLDRDGKLDVVVPLVGDRAIATLRGRGNGSFEAPQAFATSRERPYGVAVGDVDGDGTVDVVVAHDDTDEVAVLSGPKLVETKSLALPGRIGRPELVDLDGDGKLDLAGTGSGRLVIVDRGLTRTRTEPIDSWRVLAADFDGDGILDLAVPDADARVVRLWHTRR